MVILCVWISGDIESFRTHKILWNCGVFVCSFYSYLTKQGRKITGLPGIPIIFPVPVLFIFVFVLI